MLFTSSFDMNNNIRLSGEWEKSEGYDKIESGNSYDQSSHISFLLHGYQMPNWQFSYHDFKQRFINQKTDRSAFKTLLEYNIPSGWSNKFLMQDFKIKAYYRAGNKSDYSLIRTDKQKFYQGYIHLNGTIDERIQGSFYYRRNDLYDSSISGKKKPITRSEKMIFDAAHEKWRSLKFNFKVENELRQNFYNSSPYKNVGLSQFSQFNIRFSPGSIWKVFSQFNFELGYSHFLAGSAVRQNNVNSWLWQIMNQNTNLFNNSQVSRNYYIKNEYRLGSRWLIFSMIEWNIKDIKLGGSELKNSLISWSEKVDIKLGFKTRLNIQYRQFSQDYDYFREYKYYEPSIWITHRWTPDFHNNLSILYRYSKNEDVNIIDVTDYSEVRYDLLWRKSNFLKIRRVELRQNLSGIHRNTTGFNEEDYYQLASSSSIDLYPLHSLIIKFQFDLSRFQDNLDIENNYWKYRLDLKISFRF
jgi:hypothetical protein